MQNAEARVKDALRRGDPGLAQAVVDELIRSHAGVSQAWVIDCDVGTALGDWTRALTSALHAIELGDRTVMNWLRVASAYRGMQRWQDAEAALASAHAAADQAAEFAALGDFYTRIEEYSLACAAYDEAVRRAPGHERYLFNRAATRRFLGQIEQAEQDYDQVIAQNPRDWEAYHNRSGLRVQSASRNHVPELECCLTRGFESWRGEVSIRFALAKELEDLGEYDRSWRHLVAGASVRRRHLRYDVRTDVQTVEWIREAFPENTRSAGCPSTEPIFIVGMPRTGSTLLERILTSQTSVYAAGELTHLAGVVVTAAQRAAGKKNPPRRELVLASSAVDFAALGVDYLARTRPRTGHSLHFTDKMPLNYLYCGIIQRALPNARILHVTRHPLATCYAVYKTLFNQGYPFSYDLIELTDYYIAYRRLMDHWHRVLRGQILDVSYERLVTDPDSEARRVFEFCKLPWDPACLDFHRTPNVTTTASASQVRRPIYRSSVSLWKHYEANLRLVMDRLQAADLEADR